MWPFSKKGSLAAEGDDPDDFAQLKELTSGHKPDDLDQRKDLTSGDEAYDLAEPRHLPLREWTTQVAGHNQIRSIDGATVTLIGVCPRCGHQMSVELPIRGRRGYAIKAPPTDVVGKGAVQRLGRRGKKAFTKVAFCNCGTAHQGRPDDCPNGCGAFGALSVGSDEDEPGSGDPGHTRFVTVQGKPGEASIHDVAWERQAETEAGQALTSARSAAEKWTQTITSLTGVFSIVLLVKGPEDISKVTGEVDLPLPEVSTWVIGSGCVVATGLMIAVWATRNRQTRWLRWVLLPVATVIIAALVGLWAESWTHLTLILVLLGAAVVLAAAAIIAGGLAAFGMPGGSIAASGAILRHRQAKQTRLTRSLLRGSLYAATATLAVVGAAIVLTWTHTP